MRARFLFTACLSLYTIVFFSSSASAQFLEKRTLSLALSGNKSYQCVLKAFRDGPSGRNLRGSPDARNSQRLEIESPGADSGNDQTYSCSLVEPSPSQPSKWT
jgi:hypothetical protein